MIDDEQMALQVHESVGHPTELDRVYGTEAAYAGTSFVKPDDLGSLRYGSEHMSITADSTTPGGLGTFGFDEGVPAGREPIVREGILSGFLTSRARRRPGSATARGSMRADSWNRMPLVRMTNLHLEPGRGSLDELLAGVDKGVSPADEQELVDRRQKRLNFQFGTQMAWEIRGGEARPMLRDATTPARRRSSGARSTPSAVPPSGTCTG